MKEEEEGREEGGYIGRNIYEESSSMHPHPKVAPGRVPRVRACMSRVRTHAYVRVCACVRARVYTCVERDVATQAGMQFRNARVAHEASPALLPSPSPLVLFSLQEETRAREVTATRKELAGIL